MHRYAYLMVVLALASLSCGGGGGEDELKKIPPCGDGDIDFSETCDTAIESGPGSCPTDCPSTGDACIRQELVGSGCAVECVPVVSTCGEEDGCCPAGCTEAEDPECAEVVEQCGNGTLEAGEDCDPAIAVGQQGACECPTTNAQCATIELQGTPSRCQMQCVTQPVTACATGDGCCPSGCELQGDGDCDAVCGNGIVEGNELCDQNCPFSCDDGDACTSDTLDGDANNCDATCSYDAVTACNDSDGCCPAGCDSTNDSDCNAVCGNAMVEPGELCDLNCPTNCDDSDACTTDVLVGSAAFCDATCSYSSIQACVNADGCCPTGCTLATDSDCNAMCGNGNIEPPETCDGNCPASCDDQDACTTDTLTGSAATCSATCSYAAVITCTSADGCCAPGCDATNDSDCSATCGNNIVEATESCDGNCPVSCNDLDECTTDTLTGSSGSCNAACSYNPITMCVNADGCCPTGCAFANDDDCACIPDTCASLGWTCGSLLDDGCGGGGENCGACPATDTCVSNRCELDFDVGEACIADGDCIGAAGVCFDEQSTAWDQGYCTRACANDAECGVPNHCGPDGFCWQDCSSDAECRSGYQCFDVDGDSQAECAPAGTGAGAVGSSCTRYSDCGGGATGWCANEADQFLGGFCSMNCATDTDCPAGSHCYGNTACVPDCTGTADCRGTGYECHDADGDTSLECFRFANGGGAVGGSCVGIWDCSGGEYGWCNLPVDGWTGGYCTVFCGSGGTGCPNGSSCWDNTQAANCLDNCQQTNQCRTGYQCTDPGTVGRNVCN